MSIFCEIQCIIQRSCIFVSGILLCRRKRFAVLNRCFDKGIIEKKLCEKVG